MKNNLAVCIPTFKRPKYLEKCILSILKQEGIDFDIIVIDNDIKGSAKGIIKKINNNDIIYLNESNQGIPYVRNTAVKYCKEKKYKYIAFIDDDEEADVTWLYYLYKALKKYQADVVHGPIIYQFDNKPPFWSKYTHFYMYNPPKKIETGTVLDCCATNNLIMNIKIFNNIDKPFNPLMRKTGGSDTLFFKSIYKKYKMVWCDEAICYENIPKTRQSLSWNLLRNFRIGNASALIDIINNKHNNSKNKTSYIISKIIIKILILPFILILSTILFPSLRFKSLSKLIARMFYYVGYLAGSKGYRYYEYKTIHGS